MNKCVLILSSLLLLLGCSYTPLVQPIATEKAPVVVAKSPSDVNQVVSTSVTPEAKGIGIGDAKVWVGTNQGIMSGGGFYPGARAEHILPIYNYTDNEVTVKLEYEYYARRVLLPDGTESFEYSPAPDYVRDWVTIEADNVTIPAKSIRNVLITLEMPKKADVFADKWQFSIVAVPLGQTNSGMGYEVAMRQRWLIKMR